jgi:hypothetical protein
MTNLATIPEFQCLYSTSFTDSRHRHTSSTNISNSDSCETSPVRRNVTLRGGIKAGYFHKLAQYVAMELCVQLCCQEKGCDVAFMIGKNCYGVKCFSEELCHVVPANNAPRALMISKVDFRGEGKSLTYWTQCSNGVIFQLEEKLVSV